MKLEIKAGNEYRVKYPFSMGKKQRYDEDETYEVDAWIPEPREEFIPPDSTQLVADAEGEMILSVVSTHKPGRFPERVFYTRQWQDPDGKVFGKANLRVATKRKFRQLISGYGYGYMLGSEYIQEAA